MATERDNILLVYLRHIDEMVDRLCEYMQNLKTRVTEGFAEVHRQMDRFEAPLDRIEKRLDSTEAQRAEESLCPS